MSPVTKRLVSMPSRPGRAQTSATITTSPSVMPKAPRPASSAALQPWLPRREHSAASAEVTAASPNRIVSSTQRTWTGSPPDGYRYGHRRLYWGRTAALTPKTLHRTAATPVQPPKYASPIRHRSHFPRPQGHSVRSIRISRKTRYHQFVAWQHNFLNSLVFVDLSGQAGSSTDLTGLRGCSFASLRREPPVGFGECGATINLRLCAVERHHPPAGANPARLTQV